MAKFVRWMGAYGRADCPFTAAEWEVSQTSREVVAEPLWHGRTVLGGGRCAIGLIPCMQGSIFRIGYFSDVWTEAQADGTVRPQKKNKGIRSMDRFLAAWNGSARQHYGEVVIDLFTVGAIALVEGATERQRLIAEEMARRLGVPVEIIRRVK